MHLQVILSLLFICLFSYFLLCNLIQSMQWFGCVCRQKGKSYLGLIDDMQGSKLTLLDIPFTDIENIVIFTIFSFPFFGSKLIFSHNNNLNCAIMPLQTSGTDYLFVEGASGVHPSSVAKVIPSFPHHYDYEIVNRRHILWIVWIKSYYDNWIHYRQNMSF